MAGGVLSDGSGDKRPFPGAGGRDWSGLAGIGVVIARCGKYRKLDEWSSRTVPAEKVGAQIGFWRAPENSAAKRRD